jgi:hypothetical protein
MAGCRRDEGRVFGAAGTYATARAGPDTSTATGRGYPAGVIGGEAELGDWEAGGTGLGGILLRSIRVGYREWARSDGPR